MEKIIITKVDDPRVGTYGEQRPQTDVLGGAMPSESSPLILRAELGNGHYAVLPAGLQEPLEVVLEVERTTKERFLVAKDEKGNGDL